MVGVPAPSTAEDAAEASFGEGGAEASVVDREGETGRAIVLGAGPVYVHRLRTANLFGHGTSLA